MPVQPMTSGRPTLRNNRPLAQEDPEIAALIEEERQRQIQGIELIASENFTSGAVLECLGSCLTNKYSEGQAGARYYGGNDVIDKIENVCKDRMLKAFNLNAEEWGVNVQPYSGSPANFEVYTALLKPHDRVMGLDLPSGGHLTHGYYTAKKKISATSIYFESLPYHVDKVTGLLDFDALREQALLFRPKMIIAGASAYPRDIDFGKFRAICDEIGAYLLVDMAHVSGLVATGLHTSPFQYAHVVTSTTHKSLAGPRSGVIFYNKSTTVDGEPVEDAINMAVFPGLQGGPHNHQIAGLAVQAKEVATPEFLDYSKRVIKNAQALGASMMKLGHKLMTDGTDNHLLLWDVRPHELSGGKVEKVCEAAHISLNRNCVAGDKSALSPGGVRIGSPAMTSRNCTEEDFHQIGIFLDRVIQICKDIQAQTGKKLKDFEAAIPGNQAILDLKADVMAWASKFGYPGVIYPEDAPYAIRA